MVTKIKLLLLLLAFGVMHSSSYSQSEIHTKSFERGCLTSYENYIRMDSDSLIFITESSQLPSFLDDYLYDWKYRNLFKRCLKTKETISLRKVIIDRVTREDVLNWIIQSGNKKYDKKYLPAEALREVGYSMYNDFPDIPYMEYSWRDLARIRLEEIIELKKKFKRR